MAAVGDVAVVEGAKGDRVASPSHTVGARTPLVTIAAKRDNSSETAVFRISNEHAVYFVGDDSHKSRFNLINGMKDM